MVLDAVKVGLIGAGRIGQAHAATLTYRAPGARLTVVADVVEEAARRCAERFGIARATADYHQILEDREISAVLICSGTDTHAQIIEEAARAGKHVFCEKPIALSLPTIDRALAAVEQAGVKLCIGFNRRFDANFQRIYRAIREGEIGRPEMVHIISRDPAPPPISYIKVSGGIFLDMMIHDFDLARFLIGSEVDEVSAAGAVMVDPAIGEAGDLDTAHVVLRFANGVIGTIENSRRAVYGYDQRAEVLGSGGAVRVENNYPNTAVISDARNVRRDLPLNFFMERYTEAYAGEMAAFIDAVVHDRPVPVTGQDGRAPVVMALAARKSYEEHRPVRVSEVECPAG
jgi:myo-inositol 2-dehydrogenase/D-chiro-inositol 1-dehydrogenase